MLGFPRGNGYAHTETWFGLAGHVLQEFFVDYVDVVHDFSQYIYAWDGRKRSAQVCFGGYKVKTLPVKLASVAGGGGEFGIWYLVFGI